ncbi:HET-domain-containing protein [Stipitochalara longipes BDJ]|nr:HET-domain-containing protein [Stipitochalara longipes BDJ]
MANECSLTWVKGLLLSTCLWFRYQKLDSYTGSEHSLDFARRMVESCLNSHDECRTTDHLKSQTRLILVLEGSMRLVTLASQSPQHATLSHCWGGLTTLRSTKGTINSFQEQIPMDQLCKTFQQAIKVTWSLGLSYLWIDSLCIIQDDEDDWRQEAALMSEIYGNATVNIAAEGAKDGSIGLFFERNTLEESKHYIRINGQEIFEIQAREELLYERSLENTCLTARGWFFQGRFLAKRTFHFTKTEGLSDAIWQVNVPKRILPEKKYDPKNWFQAVVLYSNAKLTFNKAKLIAISGVARLWRSNIEKQLCWRVGRGTSAVTTTDQDQSSYQALSWSWASTN